MSANSAKKRKHADAVDDEDEGVVASFKIPKVEDARNGDDGNQGNRASNPKKQQ